MNVAYARVSSSEQNLDRQLESLKKYNIDEDGWFIEKVSAKNMDRPKLQEMLKFVRKGDTIYIHDFSRLARSTMDLLSIMEQLKEKSVSLVSVHDNIDTSTPMGEFMLTIIGAINNLERRTLLERQREGIAIAKATGKYKGRKEVKIDNFEQYYHRYKNREFTKSGLARELNISRPTLDKLINEYEQRSNK